MIAIGGSALRRVTTGLAAASLGLVLVLPPAAAQEDITRIYEQILQDPGNARLNFTYARLAIERGELRKALAAYERILAQDPQNEDARAGLARVQRLLVQDVTLVTVVAGAQGETNPRRGFASNPETHDGSIFGRIQITDTRRIGEAFRLRTEGDIFANWHFNFHDIDFGNFNLRTGPYLELGPDWALHAFISGGYSYLRTNSFFWEAGGGLTLETRTATSPAFHLTARFGYNFLTKTFTTRDAFFVEVVPRFTFRPVLFEGGILVLGPYWRFNGVTGEGPPTTGPTGELFPLRFHQLGGRADYFVEIAEKTVLNVNFTAEYRHYFETKLSEPGQRRDYLIAPGIQFIFAQVLESPFDVVASYTFERLFPNDLIFRYTNHIVGVRVLWRL